jgi:hypothetical protein
MAGERALHRRRGRSRSDAARLLSGISPALRFVNPEQLTRLRVLSAPTFRLNREDNNRTTNAVY